MGYEFITSWATVKCIVEGFKLLRIQTGYTLIPDIQREHVRFFHTGMNHAFEIDNSARLYGFNGVIELKLCITHGIIHIYYELRCRRLGNHPAFEGAPRGWDFTALQLFGVFGPFFRCHSMLQKAPEVDGAIRFLRLDGGHRHQTD